MNLYFCNQVKQFKILFMITKFSVSFHVGRYYNRKDVVTCVADYNGFFSAIVTFLKSTPYCFDISIDNTDCSISVSRIDKKDISCDDAFFVASRICTFAKCSHFGSFIKFEYVSPLPF